MVVDIYQPFNPHRRLYYRYNAAKGNGRLTGLFTQNFLIITEYKKLMEINLFPE